jgi:protein-tyrosine phosphatase
LYLQEGWTVLYLPIPDFGVPTKDDLEQAVMKTITYAQAGHHVVVHCLAGIGRTGLFMACLAKRVLGLSGAEALQWVRCYLPRAVETAEQRRLVLGNEESREHVDVLPPWSLATDNRRSVDTAVLDIF